MMKPPLKLFVLVLAMMGGLLFGACLSAGPVQGSDQPEFQFVPGHILIRFKEGTTARQIDGLLHGLDGTVLRSYQRLNLYHIKIGVNRDVPRALKLVREDPRVAHTQPNYVMRSRNTIPNDPLFPQQWALQNTSQTGGKTGSDIRAPQGWSIVNASSRVVAVIDTGCDYNHEDLAANMWTNPGEIPGNGVDDDGNGFVDDVHGADFVSEPLLLSRAQSAHRRTGLAAIAPHRAHCAFQSRESRGLQEVMQRCNVFLRLARLRELLFGAQVVHLAHEFGSNTR